MAKVAVFVLTLNEEENIGDCLNCVEGWANEIHVIDSNSDDNTPDIANNYTNNVHSVRPGHWANLRNWAIENLSIQSDWILFLDADECVTNSLKEEIDRKLEPETKYSGYYIPRKFIFLGEWLKYGREYEDILRLYKKDSIHYEESGDVEYAVVDGEVGQLEENIIHEDKKTFSDWIEKHNEISDRAVERELEVRNGDSKSVREVANSENVEGGIRHFVREEVWDRIPLIVRPFVFFIYAYLFRLGILDGKAGFVYHFHHKLWYRLVIYTKYKERQLKD